MADRLARHAKHAAKLFLADPLAGSQSAIGDCLDQLLIGAVDQRRLGVERLQQGTDYFEFGIPRYSV